MSIASLKKGKPATEAPDALGGAPEAVTGRHEGLHPAEAVLEAVPEGRRDAVRERAAMLLAGGRTASRAAVEAMLWAGLESSPEALRAADEADRAVPLAR